MSGVRATLAALGGGLLVQRIVQLVALWTIARGLGAAATGEFAQGVAAGGMLAVLANAGLRNAVARGIARDPAAAGSWLLLVVRARLLRLALLLPAACAVALVATDAPVFWCLSALQCVPLAFDLKHLGDAASRTRAEVLLETTAAVAFLAGVLAWLGAGRTDVTELAAIQLASRGLYAVAAWRAIAALPRGAVPRVRELLRSSRALTAAQAAGELWITADAWLVARLAGAEAAGLYAVAARVAAAAAQPSAQLARLFFAHQLHAARRGDQRRTTRVALRSLALVLLPVVGGGAVVAGGLCGLFGAAFVAAGPALALLLAAVAAQHLAWQGFQALLAEGRDRAHAAGSWTPAIVHPLAALLLVPRWGATGAAAAAALAQTAFAAAAFAALGSAMLRPLDWLRAPVVLGMATALAAYGAGRLGVEPALPVQLAAGAFVVGCGLWRSELRRGWGRLGAGLSEASGHR